MRKTHVLLCALGIVAGCGGDVLLPERVPTEASVSFSNLAGDTAITTLGDSLVARATFTYVCSGVLSSQARRAGDAVAVTFTDSLEFPVPCAYRGGYSTYRVAAGPLPAGRYTVELRFRDVVAGSVRSTTLLRTTAVVP